ncbi:MAG: metallophosphoesterase, partial [Blautia sp.]
MKKFKIVKYEIISEKLKQQGFRAAVISDLHNLEFGQKNERLLQALKEGKPDMLLIAGDLVLGKKGASVHKAYEFLREAVKLFPVFYS